MNSACSNISTRSENRDGAIGLSLLVKADDDDDDDHNDFFAAQEPVESLKVCH